jgi:hypothetical protein
MYMPTLYILHEKKSKKGEGGTGEGDEETGSREGVERDWG